jgi:putative ABC transport system permease protein
LRQEIWVPLQLDPAPNPQQPVRIQVLGKLKEGVSRRQALAELAAIARPQEDAKAEERIQVTPFVEAYTGDLQPIVYLLLAASIGLLLIVCANVSGLLTSQMIHRLPELAMRGALGATRRRLQAQLFIETTILALLGSVAGLPLAAFVIRTYANSQWGENQSFWMDVRVDFPTVLYTLAITLLVSALSTLFPAFWVTGPRLYEILQRGAGKGTTNPPGVLSHARLAGQLTLTFALLAATGLLTASFSNANRLNLGYAAEKVLTAQLFIPYTTYSQPEQQLTFFDALEQKLAEMSGPGTVAFASALPGSSADEVGVEIEGRPTISDTPVPYLIVSRGYFDLLHISALQGRLFDTSDLKGLPAAVVNQSFVRRFFPDRPPVGSRFRFVSPAGPGPWRTVVGVVSDVVLGDTTSRRPEGVYLSMQQAPSTWMAVLVRTPKEPAKFLPALRKAVAGIDRDVPVFWARTLRESGDLQSLPLRTMSEGFAVFALAAFFLSLLGAYGVTARDVSSRAREMAIRLALGGTRKDLFLLILVKVVPQIVIGLVLGVLLSLWSSRFLASLLFGVQPKNPTILLGIGCAFFVATLAAGLFPALKSLRTQPAESLRDV